MSSFADQPGHPGSPEELGDLVLTVPRPMVLLRLGYRSAGQVTPRTAEQLDETIAEGSRLLSPRAVCARRRVATTPDGLVRLGELPPASSRSLSAALRGCSEAWLFAATLGPAIDAWIDDLSSADRMTRSLLADAWASAAAIQLGLDLEMRLGRRLRSAGLAPGRRCAPGYGDWDLPAQHPLLGLLDAGRIGITLSEDGMMTPLKSVSGVIGGREGAAQATAEAEDDPSRS